MPKALNFDVDEYQLHIEPLREENIFFGTLILTGQKIGRPSQRITLHQKGLEVTSAEIIHKDKKGHNVHELTRINHLKTFGEVRLHTPTMLYPGHYMLTLNYKGKLNQRIKNEVEKLADHAISVTDLVELNLEKCSPSEIMPCIEKEL